MLPSSAATWWPVVLTVLRPPARPRLCSPADHASDQRHPRGRSPFPPRQHPLPGPRRPPTLESLAPSSDASRPSRSRDAGSRDRRDAECLELARSVWRSWWWDAGTRSGGLQPECACVPTGSQLPRRRRRRGTTAHRRRRGTRGDQTPASSPPPRRSARACRLADQADTGLDLQARRRLREAPVPVLAPESGRDQGIGTGAQ